MEEFGSPEFNEVIQELPSLNTIIEHLGGGGHDTTAPHVPPLIEMAMDAFGPQRLMWGSNFPPVAGWGEGYRNSLRLPMEHLPFKSEEDKEWIFGNTATTLFRFGE